MASFDPIILPTGRKAIIAVGSVVAALIVSMTALGMLGLYLREMDSATQELELLDAALAQDASRALQNVDLVLRDIADDVRKMEASGNDLERRASDASVHFLLRSKSAGLPQVSALALTSSGGRVLNSSLSFPPTRSDSTDREFFQALQSADVGETYLGPPETVAKDGTWSMSLARRVSGPTGDLVGIAHARIDLGHFDRLYGSLPLPSGTAVSLWRRDGTLLARHPTAERTGKAKEVGWKAIVDAAGTGSFVKASPIDGLERVVATRLVDGFPVVVNVSRTKDAILEEWRAPATTVGLAGLLGVMATAAATGAMLRQARTRDALRDALLAREAADEARRRTEEQLRHSQKLEAVGQLTGGIAHDFNNILAVSMGNLDLLRRHIEDADPDTLQHLDDANVGLERAAALTQRLLAFARRQALSPQVVVPGGLVKDMAGILGRALGSSIKLQTNVSDGLWAVEVDAVQLENAILNLALNARDAMPRGGRLFISARNASLAETGDPDAPGGEHVAIAVSDEGVGMTEEIAGKAIEPFFTTKEVGKGSGLGLSQVFGFARQSGGGLSISSRPGMGTTVTIYLPRREVPTGV